jgi:mono/diheme cytochrome c family protein
MKTRKTGKTVRLTAFLAVMAGFIAWQGREISVHAASGVAQESPASGAQTTPNSTAQTPPGSSAQATSTTGDKQQPTAQDALGEQTYAKNCAMCHGDKRQGNPPALPSLVAVGSRMTEQQIIARIHNGKGTMPAFPSIQGTELASLVHLLTSSNVPTTATTAPTAPPAEQSAEVHPSTLAGAGDALFQQHCSFCHGRDAAGGESGPDLTRSRLVRTDIGGDKISAIVRNGVPGTKMPAFVFSDHEMATLAAFIHEAAGKAASAPGGRRGVDVADLQTGNVEAGKRYFDGPGGCAKCHSATGDLAGIASRLEGLQLEEQMLYPKGAKSRVNVTLPSGQQVSGILEYQDEFTIGLRESSGTYRSWPTAKVKYTVDSPVDAHVEQFSKYTDADIHNLMAYIQTLR